MSSKKTNISRDIDKVNGYDLEIESSYSRDGLTCLAILNGDVIQPFYGANAESDAKRCLYEAVTWELNNKQEEQPMQEPTYAELVANREQAYIAQRDAERELSDLKAALTADIASNPIYKNDASRKAALVAQLQDYPGTVNEATKTADAYRAACNAIEIYQEQAKDARAKLRYETALLEFKAAEISLQVAQAKHDAAEPVDEDPWGNIR